MTGEKLVAAMCAPMRQNVEDLAQSIDAACNHPLMPQSARDGLALMYVILAQLVLEVDKLKGEGASEAKNR